MWAHSHGVRLRNANPCDPGNTGVQYDPSVLVPPNTHRRFRRVSLVALITVALSSCAWVTADDIDDGDAQAFEVAPIQWQPYGDNSDTAVVQVPIDYLDPNGDTIGLFVARYRATDPSQRIGSLLVNPGGPGFPGTMIPARAESYFEPEILARFDIVGWDPRGTGQTDLPIECSDTVDRFQADPPLFITDEEQQASLVDLNREYAELCMTRNAEMWSKVGTNNSARDMDVLRRALGEEMISYFGLSYGSELGATWSTLFPSTVRAAVLDGATDPGGDAESAQAIGFESAITNFLNECSADPGCAFHNDGNSRAAYEDLLSELEVNPAPTRAGRAPATARVMMTAVMQSMYKESIWPTLADALASASAGDGTGLLDLFDEYFQLNPDGTLQGHELDAHATIGCADDPERLSVADVNEVSERVSEIAPLFSPPGTVRDYGCSFFPPAEDPRVEITGNGAGPIVVIGTTGDPATPLASSRRMADTLEQGTLIVVDANQHTGYGLNDCVNDAVAEYLIDLVVPEDGIECSD